MGGSLGGERIPPSESSYTAASSAYDPVNWLM